MKNKNFKSITKDLKKKHKGKKFFPHMDFQDCHNRINQPIEVKDIKVNITRLKLLIII